MLIEIPQLFTVATDHLDLEYGLGVMDNNIPLDREVTAVIADVDLVAADVDLVAADVDPVAADVDHVAADVDHVAADVDHVAEKQHLARLLRKAAHES